MAGYSGTPLPKKLGIKDGSVVSFVNLPTPPPAELREVESCELLRDADVVVLFVTAFSQLEAQFDRCKQAIKQNGGLWVSWPKKKSRIPSDLDENMIRDFGLAAGLVDNKVCAVDEDWSGLRFVYRLVDRK